MNRINFTKFPVVAISTFEWIIIHNLQQLSGLTSPVLPWALGLLSPSLRTGDFTSHHYTPPLQTTITSHHYKVVRDECQWNIFSERQRTIRTVWATMASKYINWASSSQQRARCQLTCSGRQFSPPLYCWDIMWQVWLWLAGHADPVWRKGSLLILSELAAVDQFNLVYGDCKSI